MYKKLLPLLLVAVLTACGPAPQPPADTVDPAAAAATETPPAAEPVAEPVAEAAPAPAPRPRPAPAPAPRVAAAPPPPPPPAVQVCQDCGTISSVRDERVQGDASAVGTLGGAAAGGVAGAQFGKKSGKVLATIGGAVLGGLAGREIEKRAKGEWVHHVTVSMEAGGTQTVTVPRMEGLGVGSKVRVSNGNLIPN